MLDGLLYRILSGLTVIKIYGQLFFIKGTTVFNKYMAEEYYKELYEEYCSCPDLKNEYELRQWMLNNNLWKEENDGLLKKYKKDFEDAKVKLYESKFRVEQKKPLKILIKEIKTKIENLIEQRHKWDFLTASGGALIAKNKYLIGLSIHDVKHTPLFEYDSFWNSAFPLLDEIIIEYNRQSISTEEIREIARSDSWRKYWCGKETESVFGRPSIELTDDQLNLVSWTRVYDNVFQHPECPPEDVINDDDSMDGFLIADKRKRDREKGISEVDSLITNEKVRQADEIFVPVSDLDKSGWQAPNKYVGEASKIFDLNSDLAKAKIKTREKVIDKKGAVQDCELPDVKMNLQMDLNNKAMQLSRK